MTDVIVCPEGGSELYSGQRCVNTRAGFTVRLAFLLHRREATAGL